MSRKNFFILGWMFILVWLGACQATTVDIVTPHPTQTAIAAKTETAVTVSSTITPTRNVVETSTPLPSETPIAVPTQRPSPTSTPEYYDVPEWVADPTINVLLMYTEDRRGRNSAATLVNVETGERFDIPVISPSSFPRWWPETGDGLYVHLSSSISVDDPNPVIYGVHIVTGEVRKFEFPSMINNAESDTNEENDEQDLGEVEDPYDPFDGAYPDGTDVKWSSDGQMFAVGKYRWVEDELAPYGTRTEVALGIYAADGTFITKYETLDSRAWKWSPTQPNRILHPTVSNGGDIPCIWDVTTEDFECIEDIANWRDTHDAKVGNFDWSPDGNKMGFVSWGNVIGFCYIDLITRNIECPISRDDLLVEEYSGFTQEGVAWLWFIDYFWSPDQQYVAFVINAGPPESDDHTLTSTAIINLLDEDYLLVFPDGKLNHLNPWRPLNIEE